MKNKIEDFFWYINTFVILTLLVVSILSVLLGIFIASTVDAKYMTALIGGFAGVLAFVGVVYSKAKEFKIKEFEINQKISENVEKADLREKELLCNNIKEMYMNMFIFQKQLEEYLFHLSKYQINHIDYMYMKDNIEKYTKGIVENKFKELDDIYSGIKMLHKEIDKTSASMSYLHNIEEILDSEMYVATMELYEKYMMKVAKAMCPYTMIHQKESIPSEAIYEKALVLQKKLHEDCYAEYYKIVDNINSCLQSLKQ
ncbi:hypothetical protein [Wohlfahrtiimonas larvae]|uniref:Uncharacterized protein n=1 Tax=Wohlfahrtiimonas larvae TaxID=1157986 RepID=A0ABP9MVQ1_9GAMM|nr:hypothetical protein [Wohlfahrtiimonas larvae]